MNSAANNTVTDGYKFEGSKYLTTKNIGLAEIAKLIRADIKALDLDGVKVSVTISRYSMGQSIDIRVTEAPFVVRFSDFLSDEDAVRIENDRRCEGIKMPWLTDEARALHVKLEEIHDSYNFDNSDLQTDYFHSRYAGSVDFRIKGDA